MKKFNFERTETIQEINKKVNTKFFVKNLLRSSQHAFHGIKKKDSGKNLMFNMLEKISLEGLQQSKESSEEELFNVI